MTWYWPPIEGDRVRVSDQPDEVGEVITQQLDGHYLVRLDGGDYAEYLSEELEPERERAMKGVDD